MSMIYDKDLDNIKLNAYFKSGTVGLKYPSVAHIIKGVEFFIYIEGTVVGDFDLILTVTDVIGQTSEELISVSVVGDFDLILTVTDVIGQTSEELISVSVYRCASRDWIKWVGSYETDWIFWAQDFILDKSTGKCYHSYAYL